MAMLAAAWLTVAPRHLWVDKISRGFTVQERSLLEISDSTRSPVEALWNPNLPTHPVCQLCHADSPDEHRTLKRAKFPEEVSRGGHRYLKRRRRKAGKAPISEKGQQRGLLGQFYRLRDYTNTQPHHFPLLRDSSDQMSLLNLAHSS